MSLWSYHVMYAFQSESTLYIFLNVKELLARNRGKIWSLLSVCVLQVPMKHVIMSLLVFIRLTTQMRKASVINHALNKLVLGIKYKKRSCTWIADLFVRKRLAFSENKHMWTSLWTLWTSNNERPQCFWSQNWKS